MSIPLRPPEQIMRLERMGTRFQTRLSFMRSVLRRLRQEQWSIEQTHCRQDEQGYGTAVYRARGPDRCYSLIAFSNHIDAADRSDRVIATQWDASFTLFDGEPTAADIARLRQAVPRQEAGRCRSSELTLSRANKSVRLFEHVADRLAKGRQPDLNLIRQTGYLMRTTAVYGNGKFGLSDRDRTCLRPELAAPYQAELLTVYLIRCFTHDLVEHVARHRNPHSFVPLDRDARRYLGIGNSTGLGMAPFLYHHPILLNNWVTAVETALATVRGIQISQPRLGAEFTRLLQHARLLCEQWQVGDQRQMSRILQLRADLHALQQKLAQSAMLDQPYPWDAVYRWCETKLAAEAQELVVSLLIEIHPQQVDHLAALMGTTEHGDIDPAMSVRDLRSLIEARYSWALAINFNNPQETHFFWYTSAEKLEPRVGERRKEPGAEREHRLTAARDVSHLYAATEHAAGEDSIAAFLLAHPQHRHIVRRVQTMAHYPYGEIRDNLLGEAMLPIDMLRFKLAFFGATKFDPKSDKWTRINMYQGAPLPDELGEADSDRWMLLPHLPEAEAAA